jgi:exodeoxyribonuclease V gamma subunit
VSQQPVVQLHRSNRTELLADALADVLAEPLGSPLDQEWIVVPGRGMAVWLRMALARRHGVWAGGEMLYPRNFVQRVFEEVLAGDPRALSAYNRSQLLWTVLNVLGEMLDDELERPELAHIAQYVRDDEHGKRRFQLASQVTDTFDQYLTYRPELLRAWEAGDDGGADEHGEAWQPLLWRGVVERLGHTHTAALEQQLLERLAQHDPTLGSLPRRISVFGMSSLPPMYVRTMAALARHIDVHLFQLSPAIDYWSELATPRQLARAAARGDDLDAVHLERGNPLLSSLGRLGADLTTVLINELDALGVADKVHDRYQTLDESTLLGRVQADVLQVRVGDHTGRGGDNSIAIHACHGPMREVEVLHDQLLAMLAEDGDLRPQDVLVMMPDVEAYAPLVEAVFEREPNDPHFIPYRIADRSIRRDSPVLEALHRMLALVGGRATASELLDLLSLEPVRRAFAITSEDVDPITEWVVNVGIRWGIDADHRAAHGQPRVHENTWRYGLERLLLGYAMPSLNRALFAGTLPHDEVEGQGAALAGKLASFCERMFAVIRELAQPRPLSGWRDALLALLEDGLLYDGDNAWQHDRIREALNAMCEAAERADVQHPLHLDVVRSLLDQLVDDRQPARGFLTGGVTFCAMVPMRSIPFRVVGMLGMSDGAFPRARRPLDFDLMSKSGNARPGDRSRRDDDRYLFLEALLSARDRVLITYAGQSIRDNSRRPPAVVVSDLLDYVLESHVHDSDTHEEDDVRIDAFHPGLLTRHPLQPFSPRYFDGEDKQLFSYASGSCAGAKQLVHRTLQQKPMLFSAPLPAMGDALEQGEADSAIPLFELVRFFESPVAYLMRRRLGVDLREPEDHVPDREPIELGGLERYSIGDRLLDLRLAGLTPDATLAVARAGGALPPGTPGGCDHDDVLATVEPIAERVQRLRDGGRVANMAVDLHLPDGTALSGELSDRWSVGLLQHQYSRISGKHILAMWIRHLALCAADEHGTSVLVGRSSNDASPVSVFHYRHAPDAAARLAELVELYRLGQREPLFLFPKSGYHFAQRCRGADDLEAVIPKALGSTYSVWSKERDYDPYIQKLLGDQPNIHQLVSPERQAQAQARGFVSPGFVDLSLRVFLPLLGHVSTEVGTP